MPVHGQNSFRNQIGSKQQSVLAPSLCLWDTVFKISEDRDKPIYVVFLALDWHGDAQYNRPRAMECLNDYDFDPKTHNAHIRNSKITVHVCDVARRCQALEYARDHSVFESMEQLVADGKSAILHYTGPLEAETVVVDTLPSRIFPFRETILRIIFKYCPNPFHEEEPLEWVFVSSKGLPHEVVQDELQGTAEA